MCVCKESERARAKERVRGGGGGGGGSIQSKKAMNEVDAGRDPATPASVRHDDDYDEEGILQSKSDEDDDEDEEGCVRRCGQVCAWVAAEYDI